MNAGLTAQEPSAKYLVNLQPPLVRHFDLIAKAPSGVARLRELILTLAVQGKLVPQDPSDEPASELLKKIRAEKDRLIAEGNIKRDKPLAEITDEEMPFELPAGWEWVRLGSVTTYGTPEKASSIKPETWVLDLEDVEKSTGRLLKKLRYSERPALSDKNAFSAGDVLYGKLRPYLNKVFVADEDGVCTTEIMPFRCYGPFVPSYFALALRAPFFLDYVNARSYGMKMPRLGTDDARRAFFPLPPMAEQSRIVTRVEELMQLCDALEAQGQLEAEQHARLVSTLFGSLLQSDTPEALADNWQRIATHFDLLLDRPEAVDALEQTILQLAVRGLLVPQDPTDEPASVLLQRIHAEKDRLIAEKKIRKGKPLPDIGDDEMFFELPMTWIWVRLNSIGDWGAGATPSRTNSNYYGGTIPWFKSGELTADHITESEETVTEAALRECSLRLNQPGDVLIAMYGANIGKTAILDVVGTTNQAVCACTPFAGMSNEYLLLLVKALKSYFISQGSGGAQPNISREKIIHTVVGLPPLTEQSRIVTRINEICALCANLREHLYMVQAKQKMLSMVLTENATS